MTDMATIQQAVEILVREADPLRIILFGSHARGDAGPDSDVDLLVVASGPAARSDVRRKTMAALYRAVARLPINIDILLATPGEVEAWRPARNHVIARAVREGRVVYERG